MVRARPTSIRAVILDMDGLMLDTETPVQRCCQQAAETLGFSLDADFYERALLGRAWPDADAALVAHFGPGFLLDDFKARFQSIWDRHVAVHGVTLKPGLQTFLATVERLDLQKAVATSTHEKEAEAHLRAAGIRDRFSVVVTGDQIEHGKPAPDIYLEAARRLNVRAEECIALEDSDAGVLAATNAGMTTLMVPDGGRQPSAEARSRACCVLPSLREAQEVVSSWLDPGE